MNKISWDEYFINICKVVSLRSIDENTKMGCVIVSPNNRIVSTGYNGFPAGINDNNWPKERLEKHYIVKNNNTNEIMILDSIPEGYETPEDRVRLGENKLTTFEEIGEVTKYDVMAHAELNAIIAAARPLQGCKLYCLAYPCNECAKAVITSGIHEVIYSELKVNSCWDKPFIIAKKLFWESGVKVRKYET